MNEQIDKLFGGKVRVRACGLCWNRGKLLLVNHSGLTKGSFWAPPGGGVDFGKTIIETLISEFEEETGLNVRAGNLKFVNEFIDQPFHAIELYFEVKLLSGDLKVGFDPELAGSEQIIKEIRFMGFDEIQALPREERHGMFNLFGTEEALKVASGYYKI
jgi:8-oxo-dGTP diphosphatase